MPERYEFEQKPWRAGERLGEFARRLTAQQQLAMCAVACEVLWAPLHYFSIDRPYLRLTSDELAAVRSFIDDEVWAAVEDPSLPSPTRELLADVPPQPAGGIRVLAPAGIPTFWLRLVDEDGAPGDIDQHAAMVVGCAAWSLLGPDAGVGQACLQALLFFADDMHAHASRGVTRSGDADEDAALELVQAVMTLVGEPGDSTPPSVAVLRAGANDVAVELMRWVTAADAEWQRMLPDP